MRLSMELIKALKYKLRMFDIKTLVNWIKIFGDINDAVINTLVPKLKLRKMHHSIIYNYICESIASGIVLINHCQLGFVSSLLNTS